MVGYYAETLAGRDEAKAFLARRKIDHPEAVETFRLGVGDRTLGYRLPNSQLREGKRIRSRLQALGVLRSTGHEHFRGSLVVPVLDENGGVGEVYGRVRPPEIWSRTCENPFMSERTVVSDGCCQEVVA